MVFIEEQCVKHKRCRIPALTNLKRKTKVFRTPDFKAKLISLWDSEGVELMKPIERQHWLDKQGCSWHTFRKWLKDRNKWKSRAKRATTKRARQIHTKQKKGLFNTKRARGRIRPLLFPANSISRINVCALIICDIFVL